MQLLKNDVEDEEEPDDDNEIEGKYENMRER